MKFLTRNLAFAGVLLVSGLLIGCGGLFRSSSNTNTTRLNRIYQAGDRWTYSMTGTIVIGSQTINVTGTHIQTVTSVSGGNVVFRNETTGTAGTDPINEVYTETYRQNSDRSLTLVSITNVTGTTVSRTATQNSFNFPGSWTTSLNTSGVIRFSVGLEETHRIVTTGTATVTTPAGAFQTIVGQWTVTDQGFTQPRETTALNYVPELGNTARSVGTAVAQGTTTVLTLTLSSTNVPLTS